MLSVCLCPRVPWWISKFRDCKLWLFMRSVFMFFLCSAVIVLVVTFQSFNFSKKRAKTNKWTNKLYTRSICVQRQLYCSVAVTKTSKCIKMNNLIFCCSTIRFSSQFVKIFHMEKLANDKRINNKPIKKWSTTETKNDTSETCTCTVSGIRFFGCFALFDLQSAYVCMQSHVKWNSFFLLIFRSLVVVIGFFVIILVCTTMANSALLLLYSFSNRQFKKRHNEKKSLKSNNNNNNGSSNRKQHKNNIMFFIVFRSNRWMFDVYDTARFLCANLSFRSYYIEQINQRIVNAHTRDVNDWKRLTKAHSHAGKSALTQKTAHTHFLWWRRKQKHNSW